MNGTGICELWLATANPLLDLGGAASHCWGARPAGVGCSMATPACVTLRLARADYGYNWHIPNAMPRVDDPAWCSTAPRQMAVSRPGDSWLRRGRWQQTVAFIGYNRCDIANTTMKMPITRNGHIVKIRDIGFHPVNCGQGITPSCTSYSSRGTVCVLLLHAIQQPPSQLNGRCHHGRW